MILWGSAQMISLAMPLLLYLSNTGERFVSLNRERSSQLCMSYFKVSFFTLVGLMFFGTGCGLESTKFAEGFLEISYQLNQPEKIEPSFQTVIWLEDQNGQYLKSLLVSEYLSFEVYDQHDICSTWTKVADWENVPEAQFDAVTMPTPYLGAHVLKVDCAKQKLPPGIYYYCIEVHVMADYNVMYRGKIVVGGENNVANSPKIVYIPDKLIEAESVLSNVKAKYYR